MKRVTSGLLLLVVFSLSSRVHAADFKAYPGATIDQKATREATEAIKQSGMTGKATIYTTSDPFERVVTFYKGMAKEWQMPRDEGQPPPELPSGGVLRETYFIFDGAKDITTSKLWIKIQRPYIGSVEMGKDFKVIYKDVRDLTAIAVSEEK